jgi:hypothetical protein
MSNSTPGRKLALVGAYLQSGLLIGAVGSEIVLLRAWDVLGKENVSNPREIARLISLSLDYAAIGLALCLLGLTFIGFSPSMAASCVFSIRLELSPVC